MTPTLTPLPPLEAIAALRRRGGRLAPSFDYREVWQDAHASMFTVAKSAGFDILQDILDALSAGASEGSTQRDFDRRLEPILRAKGWWGRREVDDPATGEIVTAQLGSARRLRTIFETNMRVSYAQGAWARFDRDKQTRPWLRYVALMDGRARPEHAARHNLCLPVDHPYWDLWAPPCGWGCRCTLQSLSDRDVARLQRDGEALAFEPPTDRMVSWLNTRTGEEEIIPAGIDPGWAYNPGKASLSAARAIERVLDAPEGWTTAALEAMPQATRDEAYRRWMTALLDGRRVSIGGMPVGRLTPPVAEAVGATGDETWIVMTQRAVAHAMREVKQAIGRAPDARLLLQAPQALADPIAVLRARDTGELIYLVGRTSTHWERIVVRPNREIRVQAFKWRPTPRRALVATVDRVDLRSYPNAGAYDVIAGKL